MKRALDGLAMVGTALVAVALYSYLMMVLVTALVAGPGKVGATSFNGLVNVTVYCFVIGCCGVLATSVFLRYLRKVRAR